MKIQGWLAIGLAGALLCAPIVHAASSSGDVTATCKDGTSWSGKSHSGACRGHGGVQSWSDSGTSASTQTSANETSTSTHKSHSKKTESAEASGGMSSSSMSSGTSATAGVTATCKDGSNWSGKSHSGACRGHGGVQSWGGESAGAAPASGSMTSTNSSMSSNNDSGSVTATCKDGTTWTGKSHSGACRGHKGVQSWSGEAAATAAPSRPMAPPPMTPAAPTPAPTPMSPRPANTPMTKSNAQAGTPVTPKPGGGAGQVWVNESSKVYHCPNDRWYGKTKNGQYMSESQAKAQGYRPDHGKPCS